MAEKLRETTRWHENRPQNFFFADRPPARFESRIRLARGESADPIRDTPLLRAIDFGRRAPTSRRLREVDSGVAGRARARHPRSARELARAPRRGRSRSRD